MLLLKNGVQNQIKHPNNLQGDLHNERNQTHTQIPFASGKQILKSAPAKKQIPTALPLRVARPKEVLLPLALPSLAIPV